MKSFFSHTLLILLVIAICSVALFFRSELLASYEKTPISIPAEKTPIQSVPVPASIRSNNSPTAEKKIIPLRQRNLKANRKTDWKAASLSDFADAPSPIQRRIKNNIQRSSK